MRLKSQSERSIKTISTTGFKKENLLPVHTFENTAAQILCLDSIGKEFCPV